MIPLVSIIITVYNKSEYLKEAIDSALNVNYENIEIIIIDDGSTDSSLNILNNYRENKQIRIILNETNRGIVFARNKAINQAKGKFIIQLDADDTIHSEFIRKATPYFDDNDIGIVYGDTYFFGGKNGHFDLGEYSLKKQLSTNQIVITALFKRTDFLKTNGYDNLFSIGYEDWDFWLSIIGLNKKVVQLNIPSLNYRFIYDSRNNSISKENLFKIRNNIFKKHFKLYVENFHDPINIFWENKNLKNINAKLESHKSSLSFKIFEFFIFPFALIKKILK